VKAGNGGRSRGSATRADNNQPKSGSNSSRNGAGGGGDGGSHDSGSCNGDGGNGGDNAAAMAAVTAAPTWRRQWQIGRPMPMWVEVIFSLTIICITITVGYLWYRCDITIVRCMPKHKSVLREQAQQINFKSVLPKQNIFCQSKSFFAKAKHFLPKQNTFKSVLNFHNTFKSVFNLCWACLLMHFWRETISTLHTEKLSCNQLFQEIGQNHFFCAPYYVSGNS
jgi:hypothetical protein